ncbi:MAG: protein kinase, partial [Myxococcales bacterium]
MLRKLEKYEVLDEIGHGGMATVYRARDIALDRLVALKVLHPHLQRTVEARARFSREAKSVAKLRHPHILEIYDFSGESPDETYIATELLTGPTLKEFVLAHDGMPAEIAACIALQLADALDEAHAKGIIHRDVKPENVLIHEDRGVKLTDFGIAHMIDTHTFTATGQILGSPGHMAPEQVESGACDVRSDVFSLGTVLYFCAAGRLPFVGRNPHHLLKLLLGGEYPDPLRLRPAIGADLAAIMHKALSRDPAQRYQTAGEMAESLRAFLTDMGIEDADTTLESYLSSPANVTAALRERVLGRLLEIGAQAAKTGDVPRAQGALSRALALDEGNERALELLASLGRRRQRRSLLIAFTAGLAVILLTLIGYAAWQNQSEPRLGLTTTAIEGEPEPATRAPETPSSETSAVMDPNEPTTAARDMEPTVPAETPRAEAATTEEPAARDERVV